MIDSYWLIVVIGLAITWSLKEVYTMTIRKDSSIEDITLFKEIKRRKPLICCHRGGASVFGPENTMHSYRRAVLHHNIDLLEIDVRLSRDGKLIILHDDTIDRTTNGSGPAETYTLEELKKYDAGYNYPDLRGTGITIPTLEEVLDEFTPVSNLIFFFDFKSKSAVPEAIRAVQSRNLENRIIFGAVTPSINREVMRLKPRNIPLGVDYVTAIKAVLLYWTGLLWIYPLKHEVFGMAVTQRLDGILTQKFIDHLHRRNRIVAIFGPKLDHQESQRKYLNLGVDLVLTDCPDVMQRCVDAMKSGAHKILTKI